MDRTNLDPTQTAGISLPPGTILGYVAGRPVYNIAGGAPNDDEIEVDDPVEEEPEPDEEVEPAEDPKPKPPAKKDDEPKPGDDDYVAPSKSEWARTQAALKKANDDAKRHRLRNKELEDKARGDETSHEKALREAREEGEKRFRAPLVKTAARGALVEAGALAFLAEEKDPDSREAKDKGESRLNRLMRLLDTDTLDVDEDGAVAGLDAAVDDLRGDYPELFATPARRVKARPTAAPRPPADEKPKSAAEQHAQRVLGRS
ncbi:hypothetical protein ABZ401_19350 [Streptomyces sp. NPDC005892]|uniref:hypothetical protein n=1 Tax=Streptomyces sp. NPDC005892 TaxID=3155593 RepID=UPI0033CDFFCC